MDGKVNSSRGRGRPRMKWTTNITKWTRLEYHQAVRQAQHRQEWRTIASKRTEHDDDNDDDDDDDDDEEEEEEEEEE